MFHFLSGSCAQWEIYDEYIKDIERQKAEEALRSKTGKKAAAAITEKKQDGPSLPPMELPSMNKSMRILDRMVNQNMYEEIAMDFMYWEDASDAFRCEGPRCFRSAGGIFLPAFNQGQIFTGISPHQRGVHRHHCYTALACCLI